MSAGHAMPATDHQVSNIILWEPNRNSYLKTLCHYSGASKRALKGRIDSNGRESGKHTTRDLVNMITDRRDILRLARCAALIK